MMPGILPAIPAPRTPAEIHALVSPARSARYAGATRGTG
jgi:hypothetical protein